VYFSFLLYKIRVNFRLLLASFFVTFAVYNLNKLTDIKEDSINLLDRAEFTGKYKHYIIFAVIASFFTALYLSFLQSPIAIFIILFPFCLGFVYSIKISNFRLKDVIGVKSITVALAWTVIGTFLPTATLSYNFTQSSLISSFFF
jgi:4-hydroxybenzoate polyprenyltransferase